MAHVAKRKKSYAVVYSYRTEEGMRKQKWETFYSLEEALKRKLEIENPAEFFENKLRSTRMNNLLDEYVQLHGKIKWSFTTYESRTRLLDSYVRPLLGNLFLKQIDRHFLNRYFAKLKTDDIFKPSDKTLFEIYKLLHSVFEQAIHWGYFAENMVEHIKLKPPYQTMRITLSSNEIACVMNHYMQCGNYAEALLVHLAFTCSLRKGEILGLCWDDIDFNNNTISIKKELLRVSKESISALGKGEIYAEFPSHLENSKSVLVLKKPKTASSIRIAYATPSLIHLLKIRQDIQAKKEETPIDPNYHLIFTQGCDLPPEP